MNSKEVTIRMVESLDDLDTMGNILSIVPGTTNVIDDLGLVSRAWTLGDSFREFALAIVARTAIEETYRHEIIATYTCRICKYDYTDVILPKRCVCGAFFENTPPKRENKPRYPTWQSVEQSLIDIISHGTIASRISFYRKALNIGASWQEAYSVVRQSPRYCEEFLAAFEWNIKGELIGVPDRVLLPVGDDIESAKEVIREKLINDGKIIGDGDRYTKSQMIEGARDVSGLPTATIYSGEIPLSYRVLVSTPVDGIGSVDQFFDLIVVGGGVLSRDIVDAIEKQIVVRDPLGVMKDVVWKTDD